MGKEDCSRDVHGRDCSAMHGPWGDAQLNEETVLRTGMRKLDGCRSVRDAQDRTRKVPRIRVVSWIWEKMAEVPYSIPFRPFSLRRLPAKSPAASDRSASRQETSGLPRTEIRRRELHGSLSRLPLEENDARRVSDRHRGRVHRISTALACRPARAHPRKIPTFPKK